MSAPITSPSPLLHALHPVIQAECVGLEFGHAPLLEKVTPVTADLLRWWFQQDGVDARTVNFHRGQRQAILHPIYAHEVLQAETLGDLHQKLAAEDYQAARRMAAVRGGRGWSHGLLGEALFHSFREKDATMEETLQFSRLRAKSAAAGMRFD